MRRNECLFMTMAFDVIKAQSSKPCKLLEMMRFVWYCCYCQQQEFRYRINHPTCDIWLKPSRRAEFKYDERLSVSPMCVNNDTYFFFYSLRKLSLAMKNETIWHCDLNRNLGKGAYQFQTIGSKLEIKGF